MTKEEIIKGVAREHEETYIKRTPKSRAALNAATRFLPGGDTRGATFFYPYPIFLDKGSGCRVTDVDGNEYIDFHNTYTALIHGHAYPPIVKAVEEVINRFATALGGPTSLITEWAETLCCRVDSVEKVRFCTSGSEAGMMAIRTARAFTGKDKVLKIEGGFNGLYDTVYSPFNAPGLPKSVQTDQLMVPFNDKETAEKVISENKNELACVIVEGIMGVSGTIPSKDGYLEHLRKVTQENGVLLVLDEVMSFRIDYGGVQHMTGIKPDLTMFGKIIGGGFPAGAWGGREDIMEMFDPTKGQGPTSLTTTARVLHSGTFAANPVVATAGKIMLEDLTIEEIARINQLGKNLAMGIQDIFTELGIKAQVMGIGSLRSLHFTPEPVVDFKTAQSGRKELMHLVHLALLERGIYLPSRGLFALSTQMTEREISAAIRAMEDIMTQLKPIIERVWPELMS